MFELYKSKELSWIDPLTIASKVFFEYEFCAFLYSSLKQHRYGRYSYIAFDKISELSGDNFNALETIDDELWFGYLGYGLKNSIENLPEDQEYMITLPNFWIIKYETILVFDHIEKNLKVFYKENFDENILKGSNYNEFCDIKVETISSNMTKKEYLDKVIEIKKLIEEGQLYQANLTRKFNAIIKNNINYFDIFNQLCKISPSCYSCYVKYDNTHIISSSPEQFLEVNQDRRVISRPIKGTIKKVDDFYEDQNQINLLKTSIKDKAENLMIVDLMRNDFAKSCITGSIKVPDLFSIESYTMLHHMTSSIIGKLKDKVTNIEFIKNCFPPGSMTGTPKIKAMEICSLLEKHKRGVYSGCIGRISKNNTLDLSVVIRTLIIQDKKIEFQVGGAIVYDSDPINEWEETLVKAKAICQVLGINIETLKGI